MIFGGWERSKGVNCIWWHCATCVASIGSVFVFTVITQLGNGSLLPTLLWLRLLLFKVAQSGLGFLFSGTSPIQSYYCLWLTTLNCWGGIKKKCINNLLLGCINPQINGGYKDHVQRQKAQGHFWSFYWAQALLPFPVSPLRLSYFPSVCKLLLKKDEVNI